MLSSSYKELTCQNCLRGKCTKNLRNMPGHCRMEASYREGSGWKAKEASDVCHIGDWALDRLQKHGMISSNSNMTDMEAQTQLVINQPQRFPLKFACQTSVSGAFQSQLEDGIVGLEYSSASLWQQVYNSGAIQHISFSLCFGRSLKPSTDGTALAGVMTMGGVERRLHTSPMVFAQGTAKSSKSEYFYVTIRKIYLREGGGGNSALSLNASLKVHHLNISENDLNAEEIIIDSGATDTYFTKRLEAPFQRVWKQLTGEIFSREKEWTLTKEELNSLPTMLLQLRGDAFYNSKQKKLRNQEFFTGLAGVLDPAHPFDVLVAVPPSHYYEYNPQKNRYYSRFHFDPGYDSALGSSTMQGHDIFFDIDNHRIGWAESLCDYKALVADSRDVVATRDVRSDRDTQGNETALARESDFKHDGGKDEHENTLVGVYKIAQDGIMNVHQQTDSASVKLVEGNVTLPILNPFCSSIRCRTYQLVIGICFAFTILLWINVKQSGRRKRRHSDKGFQLHLAKAALSDTETDDDEPNEPLRSRSFEESNILDSRGDGGSPNRPHAVTRRYRG
ncbi:hypothetical protein MPSEU_000613000 [Mayamaea pseudoterrestris]|nr:hypothetical protein MPSEU_000613000 [Mayamaea pseudoterrestris]